MAATRLRRTFQYPSESDDEDAVEEGMDEQDQETLLSTLSNKDTTSTSLYTHLLLFLPLAPTLFYIPRLISASTILPSLAAILSLLASAYALYFLPLPPVRVNILHTSSDPQSSSASTKGKSIQRDAYGLRSSASPSTSTSTTQSTSERRHVPYIPNEAAELLARYIIPANAALCAILAMLELFQRRSWSEGMTIGGGYVPGFVLAVVMWARRELRVVDLGELERLRYRSKKT